jgi:hypothetical protein
MIREDELFSISVSDGGGVVLTDEAFPYLAPSAGYRKSIQVSLDPTLENLNSTLLLNQIANSAGRGQ